MSVARRTPRFLAPVLLALGAAAVLPAPARAAVERIEITSRVPVAEGRAFGLAGPYERIKGRVHYALDPAHEANGAVVDLDLAPRGEDGLVRFAADVHLIRPVDPERGNGTLLLEVPNRGRKAMVRYFNRASARSLDPLSEEEIGDGHLMKRGFTLGWVGWQFDVPDEPGRMRIDTVTARGPDGPIEGLVRADHVFAEDAMEMPLGHLGHRAYPVANPAHRRNVLTVRNAPNAARRVIPRVRWTFARWENGRAVPDRRSVVLFSGFEKGRIYEMVYVARDPAVAGIGLTAVRDLASYLKTSAQSPAPVSRAIGFGVSQTGRFLRHYLYQGFNLDEQGAGALDGVLIHTAGAGRGSFNHRFAQPSRDAHAFSAFFYPTDIFPFSMRAQEDPAEDVADGILARLVGTPAAPKIFSTNTGYEYWGRAASLVHTAVGGGADLELLPNERAYHFAGTQHFVERLPAAPSGTAHAANPADFLWSLRALVDALHAWVADGTEPPPSRIPTLAEKSLVEPLSVAFPLIPGVRVARRPHQAYRVDYGPEFASRGIVSYQPPSVRAPFPPLVPQVDADGNELGGIRLPEIAVPLATYTPWNWRAEELGAPGELAEFRGAFFALPRTRAAREASGDPRPSIAERYPTREDYLGRYARAAIELVDERLLLAEDLPHVIRRADELWDAVHEEAAAAEPAAVR